MGAALWRAVGWRPERGGDGAGPYIIHNNTNTSIVYIWFYDILYDYVSYYTNR